MSAITSNVQRIVTITFITYTILLIAVAFLSGKSMSKISSKNYVDEFFTGGRKTGVLMLAFITAAGICSGGTFIGGPGMDNARGVSYSLVNFFSFVFIGVNTIGTVGKKLGIIARRVKADTYMDVFMARYNNNKAILGMGAFAIVVFLISYCSSQFIGGARMLEAITGLDYKVAIILFSLVVIAYSTLGGIRGAGLASILQGTVMTIGALALGIGAVRYAGGMEHVFRSLETFDPAFVNPTTENMWWMLSLWVMFGIIYLAMPHGALGCLTYKDTKTLHKAIFVACVCTPIWSISMNLSSLASVGILGPLDVADHTTPLMAATVLHPVLAGLTISGACAAAQSTIAAMLLAISGTIVKNLYKKIKPDSEPKTQRTITTTVTLICGIIVFLMALNPPSQLEWIIMFATGGLAAGFFWPMLLGLYWTRMNQWGACGGIISGIVVYMIGKKFYTPLAFGMDPIMVGLAASLIACIAVSMITKPTDEKTLRIFWGAKPIE